MREGTIAAVFVVPEKPDQCRQKANRGFDKKLTLTFRPGFVDAVQKGLANPGGVVYMFNCRRVDEITSVAP
jgi:hypothetical protein